MKIIRMIPTEVEIDGSPHFFSVGEIEEMPSVAKYLDREAVSGPAHIKDWKIHDIHRQRGHGGVPETFHYTIENDLLQNVVLDDRRTIESLRREVTQQIMATKSLEGLIERAGFWRRFIYLVTGKLQ